MKILNIILISLSIIFLMGIVNSYTAPSYTNVTLVLGSSYTAPSYTNVTLVLADGVTNSCTCPLINTNWAVNMSDNCNITSNCNLGTGNLSFTNTTGWCNISAIINSKNGFNLYDETAQTIYINGSGKLILGIIIGIIGRLG